MFVLFNNLFISISFSRVFFGNISSSIYIKTTVNQNKNKNTYTGVMKLNKMIPKKCARLAEG